MCIDVLDDIVDKYNNTYIRLKLNLLMLNLILMLNTALILMPMMVNLKWVIV